MNRKKMLSVILMLLMLLACVPACQAVNLPNPSNPPQTAEQEHTGEQAAPEASSDIRSESPSKGETMIYAHIGEKTLVIRPENNSSAEAFVELLQDGDITVDMHDYGSFEKVGPLGTTLPTNDESITTESGDVILYQGNQITIYYDTNSWNFTRLGKVQGMSPDEIRAALGEGDPTVTFSLKEDGEDAIAVGVFDFENHTVLLNSGYTMPIMGLGTYSLDHDTCVNSVKALLKSGGRLIDTAYMYHNEEAVGEGVRQAMEEYGIPREEIFVMPGSSNPEHIRENLDLFGFELTEEEMAATRA